MPFILDLTGTQAPDPDQQPTWTQLGFARARRKAADATQTRLLASEAERIIRQYGPAAVLTATADALSYYLVNVQSHEAAGSKNGYEAVTQAIRECRQAADALRREAAGQLQRF